MNVSGAGTSHVITHGRKKKADNGDVVDLVELVGSSPSNRNWRGIAIALLVILAVCALIVVAVFLVTPRDFFDKYKNEREALGPSFTFKDMFNRDFKPRQFVAQWIGDKEIYVYKSTEGQVIAFNALTNESTVLLDNSTYTHLKIEVYSVSEDLSYVLLVCDVQPVFRHSITATYKLLSRQPGQDLQLLNFPHGDEFKDVRLQYAGFSTRGNSLTFVYHNDLYYQSSPTDTPVRITDTGRYNTLYNGLADWVYEEEILSTSVAHWWSPNASAVCFAQFNDTNVPKYQFPTYGRGDNYYGNIDSIPYPKAGDERSNISPVVHLYTFQISDPTTLTRLSPPTQLLQQEYYFTDVTWKDEENLLVTWSNRVQNKSIVSLCNTRSGSCQENLIESQHHGWVVLSKPWFIDQEHYLILLPEKGHTSHWKRISKVTTVTNTLGEGLRLFLTQGEWEVTEIVAVDRKKSLVYFIGTGGDPRMRHLYSARTDLPGGHLRSHPRCLTCDYADDCQFVRAVFSRTAHFYILGCLGPGVPYFVLKSTQSGRESILEDNVELRSKIEQKAKLRKEYYEIPLDSGQKIWAEVYLPPILKVDDDHITQYPFLVHTYGGPGSQKVTMEFQLGWMSYLTTTEDVIYASIDGRGSGGRGDDFLYEVYQRLGTVEVQDQLTAIEYLQKKFRYIDNKRTAIWGWSYGGFVTSHVLGDPGKIVNCGIAVAPVTDWRYYDTVYTERYMRFAASTDNYRGYDNANVSAKAPNFKGKHFMMVHGTADDNVHFQQSAQLIKALTEAEVDFRTQVYTDKNHALSGEKTSQHLYRTMTHFLQQECWDGGKPRDVKTEDLDKE